jgi:hypothetical protein
MNTVRLEQVTEKWNSSYKKYFSVNTRETETPSDFESRNVKNTNENCTNLTESLAPFYHYSNLPDYQAYIKDLVSIDIGGGTTDVVIVKDGNPNFVTSFRFAANDLLGLGQYVSKIISKHKQDIEYQVSEFRILSKAMSSIEQNTDFGDFASFFFSLKDNEDLTEKGKSIDFNQILKKDDKQRLVFLLFLAAIIYHTAQVMSAKGLLMPPRHLTFSGNGSRIIDVLGKKEMLEKIATLIFEKIFEKKYGAEGITKKLEIIPNTSNPKEVTCKGAIHTLDKELVHISNVVLLGIDATTFADKQTYSELHKNSDLVDNINTQVSAFFTYVFDELLKSEVKKQVGTESIERALSIPKEVIDKAKKVVEGKEDMKNITKNKIGTKEKSAVIEETFFFLPLPTLLRTISKEIENTED